MHFYFTGSIALASGAEVPDTTPSINLKFVLSGYTASGVRVNRVDCYGEVSLTKGVVLPWLRTCTDKKASFRR